MKNRRSGQPLGKILGLPSGFQSAFLAGETSMRRLIEKFLGDERGATSIEYALIAAGISIGIITVVNGIGTTMNSKYSSVNTSLK
jgi:pilus assembly protein Flp/PilA